MHKAPGGKSGTSFGNKGGFHRKPHGAAMRRKSRRSKAGRGKGRAY